MGITIYNLIMKQLQHLVVETSDDKKCIQFCLMDWKIRLHK
jgi:hypothetical protein